MKWNFLFVIFIVMFLSCSKEEGEGGLAKIKGKVFAYNLNSEGKVADSSYVGEQRIYISYGDQTTIDDEVRSSYDGSFVFNNLNKGDYTIFTFSYCGQCPLNQEVKKVSVSITERKQVIELPDFKIYTD